MRDYRAWSAGPPERVPSQLADLEARTHVVLNPTVDRRAIYYRRKNGRYEVFQHAARIVMWKRRAHWEHLPGCLIPLDKSDGRYFLKGHGRKK